MKIKNIFKNRLTIVLIIFIVAVLITSFWAYKNILLANKQQIVQPVQEVDLPFNPEGPYAILIPRRDGKALVLNIKRTSSYDQIKYELVYNSQGVDRGASGEINTADKKSEYEQEILFGSCSTGGKCVYDQGVENGTLTLHIRKGNQAFRITTLWHLQQPDLALGMLSSGDSHFTYKIDPASANLPLLKYTVVNDLSGAPKIPADKIVIGKVYTLSASLGKDISQGTIIIELADNPPQKAQIFRYLEAEGRWEGLETKVNNSKLTASSASGGIFAVLTPKSSS